MNELQELLQEKKTELIRLQAQVELLETLLRHGSTEAEPTEQRDAQAPRAGGRRSRKKGGASIPDAVEQILRESEEPLHVKELAERIKTAGIYVSPSAVTTALQRYIQLGRRFKRVAPNTFALV